MQKAKELLEDSFLTIKEIMTQIGILDKNHFARGFRQTFGTTPTEHRRQAAANHQREQVKVVAGSTAK
jgi:transcriptional regulator GlxA family with amidase domain